MRFQCLKNKTVFEAGIADNEPTLDEKNKQISFNISYKHPIALFSKKESHFNHRFTVYQSFMKAERERLNSIVNILEELALANGITTFLLQGCPDPNKFSEFYKELKTTIDWVDFKFLLSSEGQISLITSKEVKSEFKKNTDESYSSNPQAATSPIWF